jgi:hypothetical protein
MVKKDKFNTYTKGTTTIGHPHWAPELEKDVNLMTDESNVIPLQPTIKQTDLPEHVQKNIVALRRVTGCHNLLTRGRFEYSEFDAVAASVNFLQKLYMDLSEEILKCPEAEGLPDLKPLFDRKRTDDKKIEQPEGTPDGTTEKN